MKTFFIHVEGWIVCQILLVGAGIIHFVDDIIPIQNLFKKKPNIRIEFNFPDKEIKPYHELYFKVQFGGSIGECPSNSPFPLFLRNGEIRGHSPT